jgi:hypothetical protein
MNIQLLKNITLVAWPMVVMGGYATYDHTSKTGVGTPSGGGEGLILEDDDPSRPLSIGVLRPINETKYELTITADKAQSKKSIILDQTSGIVKAMLGIDTPKIMSGETKIVEVVGGKAFWKGEPSGLKGEKGDSCKIANDVITCEDGTTQNVKGPKGNSCKIAGGIVSCDDGTKENVVGPKGSFSECKMFVNWTLERNQAKAVCADTSWIITGGGCACTDPGMYVQNNMPYPNDSGVPAKEWICRCGRTDGTNPMKAQAHVICCKP